MKPGIALCVLLLAAAWADAARADEDHPLLERHPGSTLVRHVTEQLARYDLVSGLGRDWSFMSEPLEGKLDRLLYENPRDRSMLEIEKSYEQALLNRGMKLVFRCADDECGPSHLASAWNRFNGIRTKSGDDCRYLAGQLVTKTAVFHVAILVGRRRHQIDIVEQRALEKGRVAVDAEALGEEIDKTGHVRVDGIYFAFNQAVLEPESEPALAEMARLLQQRPELAVWVVGHTDSVGELERNLQLSRSRAEAVVKNLVGRGIAAGRLGVQGVGPLAPQASNQDEAGRARNRRVELVAQ